MKALVQRVTHAKITVESPPYEASIANGLCVFLGVEERDDQNIATWIAKKLANLRVFRDDQGKMNCSVLDKHGEILLISQFTLAGDCSKGNRPSFIRAAKPEIAEPLVTMVGELLQTEHKVSVKTGIFGAMMNIELNNDGPVTLLLERS
ncbi:MAG: D-tyrosyl-tRNA(Tyr) deacylase [Planctomycetes bacterium]|nr:D-tyrosyl-tRNA(Tyr) deacylase [Planctomycetota bacterium]